jgi:hypothetical protein
VLELLVLLLRAIALVRRKPIHSGEFSTYSGRSGSSGCGRWRGGLQGMRLRKRVASSPRRGLPTPRTASRWRRLTIRRKGLSQRLDATHQRWLSNSPDLERFRRDAPFEEPTTRFYERNLLVKTERAAILNSADFLGFSRNWSGRVDLNHRPVGPEPRRDTRLRYFPTS